RFFRPLTYTHHEPLRALASLPRRWPNRPTRWVEQTLSVLIQSCVCGSRLFVADFRRVSRGQNRPRLGRLAPSHREPRSEIQWHAIFRQFFSQSHLALATCSF